MIDLFKANYDGIMKAFWETNYMMLYSMLTVFFISLPLGIMLFAFSRDYLLKNRAVYEGLSIFLNALRSVPFLINVPKKIVDRAISMGATKIQIIRYFLLPATMDNLILSFTYTTISLLAYTTVMGVIGAGGLGEFAFRYGYQEYNYDLMYLIVIIFIIYVFIIQSIGYGLAKRFTNKKEK